jgi:hypothetical protein
MERLCKTLERLRKQRATLTSEAFTEGMVGVEGPLQGVLSTELLRELNDRLAEVQSNAGDEVLTLLCECAGPFCMEQVTIERRRFTAMREAGEPLLAPLHSLGDSR